MGKKIILVFLLALILSALLIGCSGKQEEPAGVKVSTAEEFYAAIQNKETILRVDDLTFTEDTKIQLNYGLTIIGNDKKATIKNAHFNIIAPNTAGDTIAVNFENIVFDGGFHTALPQAQDKSFEDIFGDEREDKRCINADWGYVDLSLTNCEITGYAAVDGSAVHIGNKFRDGEQTFHLKNCRIYGNIARNGVVKVYNDKLTTEMSGCSFTENTAGAAAGFVISNGKSAIENCKIENNAFYPFADLGFEERGGGAFLGGIDGTMKDCVIRNNETVSGGGLAITSAYSGNGTVLIRNCRIENNKAKNGGAVFIDSLQGQPIDMIGCEFYGNTATEKGSILYAEPYAYWTKKHNGGQINLLFCSAVNNTAMDKGTFGFYEADGLLGYIVLRGCLMLDESAYAPDGNYNYVATAGKALADGTVASVNVSGNGSLKAAKDSAADIVVPARVYRGWHSVFAKATTDNAIGGYLYVQEKEPIGKIPVIPVAVAAVAVLLAAAVCIIIMVKKKSAKQVEPQEPSEENGEVSPSPPIKVLTEQERIALLTERERMIIRLTLDGKTREEIAAELRFSVGTIKFDLSDIYRKLDCSSRTDLIIRYKDFF